MSQHPTEIADLCGKRFLVASRRAIEVKADIAALIVANPGIAELVQGVSPPALEPPIETATPRLDVPEKKQLPAAARAVQDPPKPKADDLSAWM